MEEPVVFLLFSLVLSAIFSRDIYTWLTNRLSELTFAARGIELWERRQDLVVQAAISQDGLDTDRAYHELEELVEQQNAVGDLARKLAKCNLAIFVYLGFITIAVYILELEKKLTLSTGSEVWLLLVTVIYIYGSYSILKYTALSGRASGAMTSRYPLLICVTSAMLIAWLFFGFSWFVTLIVIPVAIIIATPIFRISIAHSVNRENDEEVPLGISKAMYLEGAHIEMLVLVSSSVFVFVVEIFLRDLAVRALDELPELLLISAKALIIVTPLLILTYRFLANATLSTISGVYIAAFDADLREDNSSQPTS